ASVDAGAVLAHLIGDGPAPSSALAAATVILRTNHRSEPHIRDVAAAINRQETAALEALPILQTPKDAGADWSFLAQEQGVPRLDRPGRGLLFAGAPVLVTRNDPARGLFNGDVGLTLRGADGAARVVFSRQGSFLALPAEALPAHELGFALTVHKSQGSEYGQ